MNYESKKNYCFIVFFRFVKTTNIKKHYKTIHDLTEPVVFVYILKHEYEYEYEYELRNGISHYDYGHNYDMR
jgi:hypothetical protein